MTNFFRFFLLIFLVGLTSCRTKYVPVERVRWRTDSVAIERADSLSRLLHQRDSVVSRDSVIVMMRGDTVIKEAWRCRERVSLVHDTVRIGAAFEVQKLRRDSVREPVIVEREVINEVPRELSWRERTLIGCGYGLLGLLTIGAVWLALRAWLRRQVMKI